MAGDWLKWSVGLCQKIEILSIASRLHVAPAHAAGTVMILMEWVDNNVHTFDEEGNARVRLGPAIDDTIDQICKLPGFAETLAEVGWLRKEGDELVFVHVGRHNPQTAKDRANATNRQVEARAMRQVELRSQLGHNSVTVNSDVRRAVIPRELRRELYKRDGYRCVYCGRSRSEWSPWGDSVELSLDHVIPVCVGGKTEANNLVTACLQCNMSKSGRTLEEAKMEMKFLSEKARKQLSVTGCDQHVTREEKRREEEHTLPAKPAREKDLIFETLCEIQGSDYRHLTATERGKINAARKQILDADPDTAPDDIRRRARKLGQTWTAKVTAPSLAAHWSECGVPPPRVNQAEPPPSPISEPQNWRSLVEGDKPLQQYVDPKEPWENIERYFQKEIADRCAGQPA